MENEKCKAMRDLERSVVRMREKLTAIKVGANAALELSAPDADGNFANLGRLYLGLSMALGSIREICGPSIVEGGAE